MRVGISTLVSKFACFVSSRTTLSCPTFSESGCVNSNLPSTLFGIVPLNVSASSPYKYFTVISLFKVTVLSPFVYVSIVPKSCSHVIVF